MRNRANALHLPLLFSAQNLTGFSLLMGDPSCWKWSSSMERTILHPSFTMWMNLWGILSFLQLPLPPAFVLTALFRSASPQIHCLLIFSTLEYFNEPLTPHCWRKSCTPVGRDGLFCGRPRHSAVAEFCLLCYLGLQNSCSCCFVRSYTSRAVFLEMN